MLYHLSFTFILVNTYLPVIGANPNGRFLSLDIHSGLWYDVGFDRAVAITYENLLAESGRMYSSSPKKMASVKRTFVSKAA